MKKVGEVLAEQRNKLNIPLEKISQHTKIRVEFLRAIEANEFTKLPPAPFVKGFLHTYSQYLGLDPKTVLALLRRDFKTSEKGQIIPRQYLKPLVRKRVVMTPKIAMYISSAVVVFIIISYGAFQWWRLRQPPELRVETPLQDATVEKTVVVKGRTAQDAVVFVDAKPVSIAVDGTFETSVFYTENGTYIITVKAQDRHNRESVVQRTVKVEE